MGKLVERPHVYGVAALAGLAGEVAIDGKLTVIRVDASGRLWNEWIGMKNLCPAGQAAGS